jgi:hypothetical protein
MNQQMQTPKTSSDQPRPQMPMRRLDDKEMRRVAGGPIGCPTLTPKKP